MKFEAIFSLAIVFVGLVAMAAAANLYNVPVVSGEDDIRVIIGEVEVQAVEPSVNVEIGDAELTEEPLVNQPKPVLPRKGGVARSVRTTERQGSSRCFWHTPSMGLERVRVCDSNYVPPDEQEQLTKRDYAEQTAAISVGMSGPLGE